MMLFRFMVSPWVCFVLAVPIVMGPPGVASPARQPDTEADLLARIQREQNPVKKAKYETRLGRVKLLQAIDAYDKGNLDQCRELLGVYLARMKSAWQTLRSTGRRAVRQPQGFKELDIGLREDARTLDDLAHRLPYSDRDAVERTAREVDRIRSEVLRALFPSEHSGPVGNKLRHRNASDPLTWNFLA